MASIEAQCVVAIAPNYWGKGASIKEAEAQLKKRGYRETKGTPGSTKRVYYFFECKPSEVEVRAFVSCEFFWPEGTAAMRLEEKW